MGREVLPMKIYVWSEARFTRTSDGAVWTETANAYAFWTRYLAAFDHVGVVARVQDVRQGPPGAQRVDGSGVSVEALPYYEGPRQLVSNYRRVRSRSLEIADDPEATMLFRVPSIIAGPPIRRLRRLDRPYGLEVVGDPQEVFRSGASDHPLRWPIRIYMTRGQKQQCEHAAAVSYVTRRTLQARYAAAPGAAIAAYSSVQLDEDAYVDRSRTYPVDLDRPVELVTIAAMDQPYKGVDTLIQALPLCAEAGLECRLKVVGDGRLRGRLEDLAGQLTAEGRVEFVGTLPQGPSVRAVLDQSDIFVLASHTEGLPRALLEAMARGLPCVATEVGGIPELLGTDEMVRPGDPAELAAAIQRLAQSSELLADSSRWGLETARGYAAPTLARVRDRFYHDLREVTERNGSR